MNAFELDKSMSRVNTENSLKCSQRMAAYEGIHNGATSGNSRLQRPDSGEANLRERIQFDRRSLDETIGE